MITLLALRNPEPEYARTRHNIGADVLRAFAESNNFPAFKYDKFLKAEKTISTIGDHDVQLLLSGTYMNESGQVVAASKLTPEETIVIHDELNVPVGDLKISYGAGAGGHNGVASVTSTFGTAAYTRLRIGIEPNHPVTGDARANFVLKPFTPEERQKIEDNIKTFTAALITIIKEGRDTAMLKYHTK
ncbi:hypothetical protein A3C89_00035 [Candidatus Kaiserbacteria bacterium RIFCSPHIGHO2_02_FULL_50_50]|uniref:Aminoacyl-tRNA hydrolase n=1 Tax=Candidatus Kaiserbacteria bacterium RIFCSPHIGHO2_02_FULL_50_50 TaxID=1798492 RepID=A0A1F6DHV8_9BACT|nr:MAG: hypothetical protein A3C89_00035 [Candidatus Kaiserbacteria bacterium RIFCSPHIGHO2_02_FULL_50_50]OGG88767.1 MAG: hypothetical protein A3G62_01630 [Candidatus Kaiserbacteria bacterium RIFCSPLOWO2_12_FULL_50_10]